MPRLGRERGRDDYPAADLARRADRQDYPSSKRTVAIRILPKLAVEEDLDDVFFAVDRDPR
jgi:hypothetical protein